MPRADRDNMHKLQTYYRACTDLDARNAQGAAPLARLLDKLPRDRDDVLAWMHGRGFPVWFDADVQGDEGAAPTKATPVLRPASLGLPDPSYYEDKDTRAAYEGIVQDAWASLREAELPVPSASPADVVELERALARITPPAAELSDPLSVYHPHTLDQLKRLVPGVAWEPYFKNMSSRHLPDRAVVASVSYLVEMGQLMRGTAPAVQHAYAVWSVVRTAGAWLGPDVRLSLPARRLRRLLQGVADDAPEDYARQCVDRTNAALGYMAGRFYVAQALTPDDRLQVSTLIESIRDAFYDRLNEIKWLDDKTRAAAHDKAAALQVRIGYPSVPDTMDASAIQAWYAGLHVSKDAFANELAARTTELQQQWSRLSGELNLGALGDLTTVTVNAEYIPPWNQIVFPAGILQPPFFQRTWPRYLQYATLGMIAGHELSHAFDPHGRHYDADGFLRDWWTPATADAFEAQQACIEAQYANYTVDDGHGGRLAVDARLTVGENVADAGGLAQSYRAWKHSLRRGSVSTYEANQRLPGLLSYSHEQLFFIAFAQIWAERIRAAEQVRLVKTDAHAPNAFRVNGAVANFAPFAEAFGCDASRPSLSVRRPEDRCTIW